MVIKGTTSVRLIDMGRPIGLVYFPVAVMNQATWVSAYTSSSQRITKGFEGRNSSRNHGVTGRMIFAGLFSSVLS